MSLDYLVYFFLVVLNKIFGLCLFLLSFSLHGSLVQSALRKGYKKGIGRRVGRVQGKEYARVGNGEM